VKSLCREEYNIHPSAKPEFLQRVLQPEWSGASTFAGGSGYSIDTRTLMPGEIFIALKTEQRDGHQFLREAQKAGASAAIVDRPVEKVSLPQAVVHSPLLALQALAQSYRKSLTNSHFIGVTGSCGKTSTKEILGILLGGEPTVFTSRGNLNNHLGLPLSLLSINNAEKAVLETGISGSGEMEVLASILQPNVAVITTISPAHTERIRSLGEIACEKEKLASSAREAVFLGSACILYDVFTASAYPQSHWVVPESVVPSIALPGTVWIYRIDNKQADQVELSIDSLGTFSVLATTAGMLENMAIAIVLAAQAGIANDLIQDRLLRWRPSAQRGEIIKIGSSVVYADHYNANPSSMADAIDFFHRRFQQGPRLWILGGMEELGDESELWHRRVAAALPLQQGDRVILVGESAKCMLEVIRKRTEDPESVLYTEKMEGAENALSTLPPKIAIFLKGSRKHRLEQYMEICKHALLS